MSLKAIARPTAREPGPLVILVRWRTVAKVHIRLVVRRGCLTRPEGVS